MKLQKLVKVVSVFLLGCILLLIGGLFGMKSEKDKLQQEEQAEVVTDIAIVNLDEGIYTDNKKLYYSTALMDLDADNLVSENLEAARQGINNGSYAAYILIPSDFSNNAVSINAVPQKSTLEFAVNPNLREDISRLTMANIKNFEISLNTNMSYMYVQAVLEEFHDVQDSAGIIMDNDRAELIRLLQIEPENLMENPEESEIERIEADVEEINFDDMYETNMQISKELQENYDSFAEQGQEVIEKIKDSELTIAEAMDVFYETVAEIDVETDEGGNIVYEDGIRSLEEYLKEYETSFTEQKNEIFQKTNTAGLPLPTPTVTPTPIPTIKPTPRPTVTPRPTATPRPTKEPTPTPIATPAETASPSPTPEESESPTPEGSPGMTESPTPEGSPGMTESPTPEGSPGMTESPTPEGSPGMTERPIPEESPGITESPTPEKSPEMTKSPDPEGSQTPGTKPGNTGEPTSEITPGSTENLPPGLTPEITESPTPGSIPGSSENPTPENTGDPAPKDTVDFTPETTSEELQVLQTAFGDIKGFKLLVAEDIEATSTPIPAETPTIKPIPWIIRETIEEDLTEVNKKIENYNAENEKQIENIKKMISEMKLAVISLQKANENQDYCKNNYDRNNEDDEEDEEPGGDEGGEKPGEGEEDEEPGGDEGGEKPGEGEEDEEPGGDEGGEKPGEGEEDEEPGDEKDNEISAENPHDVVWQKSENLLIDLETLEIELGDIQDMTPITMNEIYNEELVTNEFKSLNEEVNNLEQLNIENYNSIFEDEVLQPLRDEVEEENSKAQEAGSVFMETMDAYMEELALFDPYEYYDYEKIDSLMAAFGDNIFNLEEKVYETHEGYEEFVYDAVDAANAGVELWQENLDKAYDETAENVQREVELAKQYRQIMNETNTNILGEFQAKLPYTRIGRLEYVQAYDFIVKPIQVSDLSVSKKRVTILQDSDSLQNILIVIVVIWCASLCLLLLLKIRAVSEENQNKD